MNEEQQITVHKGFLSWLLYKAMGDMCGGKFCKNCPFERENNPYNTDCEKELLKAAETIDKISLL